MTGKLQVRWDPVDLREVVEAALELLRPAAVDRHIVLTVSMPHAPCMVNGDRDRLQQVASNLLSNAVKFTPDGGQVRLDLAVTDGTYQLTVTDTGIGIPADFVAHVFDRFRQADASTTRAFGGLGLGLSIVKELVELHGGSVTAASPGDGRGATFTVRLPMMRGLEHSAPTPSVLGAGSVVTMPFGTSPLLEPAVMPGGADGKDSVS